MSDTYHDRDNSSAWGGNGDLAFFCGQLFHSLEEVASRNDWQTEMPFGYTPVVDLVTPSGKRFRLRVEEVVSEGGTP